MVHFKSKLFLVLLAANMASVLAAPAPLPGGSFDITTGLNDAEKRMVQEFQRLPCEPVERIFLESILHQIQKCALKKDWSNRTQLGGALNNFIDEFYLRHGKLAERVSDPNTKFSGPTNSFSSKLYPFKKTFSAEDSK
ncbi:hypothetical protein F5878DRAFT_713614 [Lentinula raphanica]|uniref:Uncharacterized protein n=1 Tax=Lentinula raphanica TaxID=153919 RepID=A0AA38NXX0_9AGAR|nr:hypothetical protein F5878DRAFT_713614 [Lentinula raphanica]